MSETMPFSPLYKLGENGNLIVWDIKVLLDSNDTEPSCCNGIIVTRWGQEGGAIQETRDVVKEGKNTGKKNATTAYEQACKEAESKWTKQQKAHKYTTDREGALKGERSELITGGFDCMLAHPIEKKLKHAHYPAMGQPKLDGHRCLATIVNGKATLWSRTRKPINSMPHIVAALEKLFRGLSFNLDGELYNHNYHDNFEDLTGFITADEPVEGHEIVQYHIYDTFAEGVIAEHRQEWLNVSFLSYEPEHLAHFPPALVRVETVTINDPVQEKAQAEKWVEAGYEGLIHRNPGTMYEGKRSTNLLKVKFFVDEEFPCVAVTSEHRTSIDSKGNEVAVDYPVFTVQLADSTTCNAPMMGKRHVVKKYLDNPSLVIGKLLTVKYQGYTKEGSLRFPKCRLYVTL